MQLNRQSLVLAGRPRVRTDLTLALSAALLAITVTPSICRADFSLSRPDVTAARLTVRTQAEFEHGGTTRSEHPFMFGDFADSLTQTSADSKAAAVNTAAITTDIGVDPGTGVVTIVVAGQTDGTISGARNARINGSSQFQVRYETTSPYADEITGGLSLALAGDEWSGATYRLLFRHGLDQTYAEESGSGNDTLSDSINASGVIDPGEGSFSARAGVNTGGTSLDSGTFYSAAANFDLRLVLTPVAFRWTNVGGGLFSERDNWETGAAPVENDTAIIDEAGTYTITLDDSVTNAGLNVSGNGVDATLDPAEHGYSVGELTIGDGGFGIIDVELGGQLTTAGGQLGATDSGGPGHVTTTNPDSRWTSTEAIVLAGTGFGDANPGRGTGQAILNVPDNGTVETPLLTLGAGLAPGYLSVPSGGEMVACDGIDLRWGNMDVAGPSSEVRSPNGTLAVGNASAPFTGGASGSFDQVIVQAPLGGGHVSELIITDATVEATNTDVPAVIVGGEAGGLISMTNGLLDAEGGEVHIESNGTIAGTGTVRGNVTGAGTISPGLSPGTLTIDGDYTQTATGSLILEIAGLTPSLAHDVLVVTGDATFDGQIILKFIDNLAPKMDDSFDLMEIGGTLDLTSAGVLDENLMPGFDFDVTPTTGGMRMTALNDGRYVPEPASLTLLLLGGPTALQHRAANRGSQ